MFQRAQIFRTQISLSVLLPSVNGPILCGPYPGPTDAFNSSDIEVGHHLHDDESMLALLYISGGARVTFVLDPWSDATRNLLCEGRDRPFCTVALAGTDDRFIALPSFPRFWVEALEELDEHRKSHTRRHPRDFIGAAFCANFIAELAIHPNDPARLAEAIPGSASVTILLAPEHLPHLGS